MCFVLPTHREASGVAPLRRRPTGPHRDAGATFPVVADERPDGGARPVRELAASEDRIPLEGAGAGASPGR